MVVSGVDEGGVEDRAPVDAVLVLARRKAQAVAGHLTASSGGALVIA